MRLAILGGDSRRHHALAARLANVGHEVWLIAEAKADAFNEEKHPSDIISAHRQAMDVAIDGAVGSPSAAEVRVSKAERNCFKDDRLLRQLRDFSPDLLLAYGCGIIGAAILTEFSGRVIGSHQGLPQYFRGSASNYFAFLNGRAAHMGVSLHHLDTGIDTGPVLLQRAPEPESDDTYYTYSARLVALTLDLYVTACIDPELPGGLLPSVLGELYLRKDFTPETMQRFYALCAKQCFASAWHESRRVCGIAEWEGDEIG